MTANYQYAGHVKFVGILEIIFQVLSTLVVFVALAMLAVGAGAIFSVRSRSQYDFPSNTIHIDDTAARDAQNAVSGMMIAGVVILVLVVIFQAWMVHLVFSGGQKQNAGRLTIWYIVQSVFTAFHVLGLIAALMIELPWFCIVIGILQLAYRIYSIHVVRCHAAEINEYVNSRFSVHNQI